MNVDGVKKILRSELLRPVRDGVRDARDYLHHQRRPWFEPHAVTRGPHSSTQIAMTLKADGVCVVEGHLDAGKLAACRSAVAELFADTSRSAHEPGHHDCRVSFARHPALAEIVLDELIIAAFEAYYERPIHYCMSHAIRLPSVTPRPEDKAWHHDSKGKLVKAMWLLTDVPVTGQRMSYLAGSHATKHQWRTHEDTRFTEARARAIGGRVVECAAPAGSVVLFDTNGVHRPNRNAGPVRDTLVGVYSAGRYREGCEVDASVFSRLSSWQLTVLERSRMRSGGPR